MLPLLLLGWTLNYEMFFYGVFAVGLRLRRGAAIAAIAVLFVLMTIAGLAYPLPEPLRFWTDLQIWSSSTGCCSPRLYLRGIRMPRVAAGLAIAIGMVGLMAYYPGPGALPRGIGWGLPAAALFAGTVLSERWKIGSLGILHVLGAASDPPLPRSSGGVHDVASHTSAGAASRCTRRRCSPRRSGSSAASSRRSRFTPLSRSRSRASSSGGLGAALGFPPQSSALPERARRPRQRQVGNRSAQPLRPRRSECGERRVSSSACFGS